MNIKYRQLKAFVLAAQHGSFAAGADRFAITAPSFSVLIKELERDVGVELFERTTRSCRLTDAGQAFHDQISASLGHIEDAYANLIDVARGQRGWLRLASLSSLSSGVVNTALTRYRRQYPYVDVQLCEATNEGVYEAVRQRKAEIGVCSHIWADQDLSFIPLYEDRLVAVMPAQHELMQAKGQLRWKALEAYPYVLLRSGTAEYAQRASVLKFRVAAEVDNLMTAVAMVRQGAGITVILARSIAEFNTQGLAWRPIYGPMSTRKLGVVHARKGQLGRSAQFFIEMLQASAAGLSQERAPGALSARPSRPKPGPKPGRATGSNIDGSGRNK